MGNKMTFHFCFSGGYKTTKEKNNVVAITILVVWFSFNEKSSLNFYLRYRNLLNFPSNCGLEVWRGGLSVAELGERGCWRQWATFNDSH